MGTLRFDLNSLAVAKAGKEEKKKALALRKDFIRSVSTARQLKPWQLACVLSDVYVLKGTGCVGSILAQNHAVLLVDT